MHVFIYFIYLFFIFKGMNNNWQRVPLASRAAATARKIKTLQERRWMKLALAFPAAAAALDIWRWTPEGL